MIWMPYACSASGLVGSTFLFVIIPFGIALIDWWSLIRHQVWVGYVAKPGVMVALMIWLGINAFPATTSVTSVWFGLALLFSIIGDIFLMLPSEKFIAGLVAFLCAHLSYIMGFDISINDLSGDDFAIFILVLIIASFLFRPIFLGVLRSGKSRLPVPVVIYALVITLMLLSALLTLNGKNWDFSAAILVSLGAFLFFISDAILAWNRFVRAIHYGRLKTRIPYHLGQMLLVMGGILHSLS